MMEKIHLNRPSMKKGRLQSFNFVPSHYQERIFDELQNSSKNLVVEACAGSGKTTTILKSLDYLPNDKLILMIAFNKAIVANIKKRVHPTQKNVEVRTLHAMGLQLLKKHFVWQDGDVEVNPYKYSSYLNRNFEVIFGTKSKEYSSKEFNHITKLTIRLCDLARCCQLSTNQELVHLANRYGLEVKGEIIDAALNLMDWGKSDLSEIDYVDMIWLPNVLDIQNPDHLYDYVFVDECQDLNTAQRELMFRCLKPEGRFIAVGDRNQAIYSFAGADVESFDKLAKSENTLCLPLSISYRCGDAIVDFARLFVPNIEANPNSNNKGRVEFESDICDIEDDAMVLCRNNAPLANLYMQLLEENRPAYIKGRDIGTNLCALLETSDQDILYPGLRKHGVFSDLVMDMVSKKNDMKIRYSLSERDAILSPVVQERFDQIKCLYALSQGCITKRHLAAKIEEVFKDEGAGIMLSTIHKAKGLEADNVYILNKSLMPSPLATKDWEREQEKHLQYVAYTRAKKKLSFLCESPLDWVVSVRENIEAEFLRMQRAVEKLVASKEQDEMAEIELESAQKKKDSTGSRVLKSALDECLESDQLIKYKEEREKYEQIIEKYGPFIKAQVELNKKNLDEVTYLNTIFWVDLNVLAYQYKFLPGLSGYELNCEELYNEQLDAMKKEYIRNGGSVEKWDKFSQSLTGTSVAVLD